MNNTTIQAIKVIYLETNFAGKLDQLEFLHVSKAPTQPKTESQLERQVFEVHTSDGSHPPVRVKLKDFVRIPLYKINGQLSRGSHGLSSFDLQSKILDENPQFNLLTPFAAYFYRKIQ